MSSLTPPAVPTASRRVVIEGLEKAENANHVTVDEKSSTSTLSITMHEDEPLSDVWNRIKDSGFEKPDVLMISNVKYYEYDTERVVSNHEEVVVVADDQISTKNTIRITESLISHANTHHGQTIDFNITPLPSSKRAIETNCGFHVAFERTPRMPDDNKLHQLPGSLGSYDLFSVESYADRLPRNIRESGGVFFPMWQREAMWLNFKPKQHKCAVRAFMGHVNTVSGLTMEETAGKQSDDLKQDYIVIPGQRWLDGICVAPGVVRQFVAMPLGSGYTVEGQKTSKEQHGGLQLEITPEFLPKQRLWSYGKDHYLMKNEFSQVFYVGLDERLTPQQLSCKIGDVLRSYPADTASEEPFRVKHLAKPGADIACTVVNKQRNFWDRSRRNLSHFRGYECGEGCQSESLHYGNFGDFGVVELDEHGVTSSADYLNDDSGEELSTVDPVKVGVVGAKDIKTMGLAAGGKLIQDIYKDPYPATIWNHAAARILHVHILDPMSCEKVTHMVPQPPPIDAKAYTEAGGQYFVVEEKVDERLDGGDFDNVKSVSQMDQHVGISTEPEFDPTKPKMCTTCELRLCDCIIRPCDHQFCNICIKRIEQQSDEGVDSARRNWKCPTCGGAVSHVAGFSAPMNLPGEEPLRIKVPVNVLKIEDGRARFESVQKTRI